MEFFEARASSPFTSQRKDRPDVSTFALASILWYIYWLCRILSCSQELYDGNAGVGAQIEFDKVLLVDNEGQIKIGTPVVEGAKVTAKVLSHLKGDKVVVFKKKRRKGYCKKNGHRQYLTQIQIEAINA